jgi:Arylsulfotransferase (ASST)
LSEQSDGRRSVGRREDGELWTRRRFLGAAAATAAAAGIGVGSFYGYEQLSGGASEHVHRFVSRPDLSPPLISVRQQDLSPGNGFVFLAPAGGAGQHGPLILGGDGEPVWFDPLPGGAKAMNFRVQRYRGEPVLTWWQGRIANGYGQGHYVIANRSYQVLARFTAGEGYFGDLHEFQLTERGSALVTSYRVVSADLRAVGGPPAGELVDSAVQEIDVATGRVLFHWSGIGRIALSESYRTYSPGSPFDYLHLNSIDVGPDGNLLVSARHTWSLYELNRRDGEIVWRLGGKQSDFRLGAQTRFAWQHDARWRSRSTITLFDDGAQPKVESQSRGLVLRVDRGAGTVALAHEYVHPTGLLAVAQGSFQSLPDGDVFVGWGTEPYYSEFSAGGRLRLDARFVDDQESSYRAYRHPWTGRPRQRPALRVERHGAATTLWVSWNGATDVASWQVDAGAHPARLQRFHQAPRAGFETTIRLSSAPRYLAVSALDRTGRALGSSETVRGTDAQPQPAPA